MNYNDISKWLKSLSTAPAKWRRRSHAERMLLAEAFILLGIARLAVIVLPFRWLAVTLGMHMKETAIEIDPSLLPHARMIGQAIRSAADNTPWKSLCLAQAVTGQWMLKRRHINGTLYLGVSKDKSTAKGLSAHAWLRCGSIILTGREGHRQFTIVSTFS